MIPTVPVERGGECSLDPNTVDYIFLPGRTPAETHICPLTAKCARGHSGHSWFEYRKFSELHKTDQNHELLKDLISRAEARQHIANHYAQAVQEAREDGAPAIKRGQKLNPKEIKKNREEELKRLRKEHAEETERLLALNGLGKRKEKGKPVQPISKGDDEFYRDIEASQQTHENTENGS